MTLHIYCPKHPLYTAQRDPRADCDDCWTLRSIRRDDRGTHRDICATNVTIGRRFGGRVR